jgi:hypothetical protein
VGFQGGKFRDDFLDVGVARRDPGNDTCHIEKRTCLDSKVLLSIGGEKGNIASRRFVRRILLLHSNRYSTNEYFRIGLFHSTMEAE